MSSSARANLGCVVRAGRALGQSRDQTTRLESAHRARALRQSGWARGTLAAWRADQSPSAREPREATHLLSGDEVELWTGEQLEHREVAHPGDYLYIPAGVPHVAVNRSETPAICLGAD